MEWVHPQFRPLLAGFGQDILACADTTIFGLWPDLTFAYFNDGWFRFAAKNNGEPRISREWTLGRSLLDSLPDVLADFYRDGYRRSLATGNPWGHEYECSSPETFRLLHQQVYPLGQQEGLLAIHTTCATRSIASAALSLDLGSYLDKNGVLHQCCHCRKFKNLRDANRWEWVGEWIRTPPEKASHGFCPACMDYHYPGFRRGMAG